MVEVIVSLAIMGLLMSVLVPAVQQVRESSRRMTCSSHLRQIMLAQHNYHASNRSFAGNYPGFSWTSRLYPFLETPQGTKSSPLYICPSDPESLGEPPVQMSYQTNHGTGDRPGNGFAGNTSWVSDRDISDGLSSTAAYAERLAAPAHLYGRVVDWSLYPQFWKRRFLFTPYLGTDLQTIVDDCRNTTGSPPQAWFTAPFYTHVMTPNGNSCTNGSITGIGLRPFAATASSLHSGGVNLALADGSVRFASNSIDLRVWWALGTRAGGEPVSVDF